MAKQTVIKTVLNSLLKKRSFNVSIQRVVSTSGCVQSNGGDSWFNKLLMVRKIEPGHDSHSKLLSTTDIVYELQIHDVKPENTDAYLANYESWSKLAITKSEGTELVASFRVEIGDQDQYIHIWRFHNGYPHVSQFLELCHKDSEMKSLIDKRLPMLRYRENQFMLPFTFWGHPKARDENQMYEMRSYVLKPGTMIEWGNNWARGIQFRKDSAIAGFFSQIGQLYMVHHIWAYHNLQDRKEVRDAAWRKPGWDECVSYTVPLIREMRSRWMRPLPFSPIK